MNEVVHTSPTIGSNVEEIVVKNTHFLMWDIGGQESLRSSWNTYYSNTEVRNTSNTMGAHFVHFERRYCPAAGFFPRAWQLVCLFSAPDGSRGRPKSEVGLSQRGPSDKQSEGQPPQCFGEEEQESHGRGRCVEDLKESSLTSASTND